MKSFKKVPSFKDVMEFVSPELVNAWGAENGKVSVVEVYNRRNVAENKKNNNRIIFIIVWVLFLPLSATSSIILGDEWIFKCLYFVFSVVTTFITVGRVNEALNEERSCSELLTRFHNAVIGLDHPKLVPITVDSIRMNLVELTYEVVCMQQKNLSHKDVAVFFNRELEDADRRFKFALMYAQHFGLKFTRREMFAEALAKNTC